MTKYQLLSQIGYSVQKAVKVLSLFIDITVSKQTSNTTTDYCKDDW